MVKTHLCLLASDLQDLVKNWNNKLLVNFNAGKIQIVSYYDWNNSIDLIMHSFLKK